ncbi:MAG: FecR domain-containing protein [Prevotella sp.]|jgi:ferric-dicitrate binding protein FerR (iron transport regulator)|nr:FecR domain-containing protein [Prevotella sp.]
MRKEYIYTLISRYFNDECTRDESASILDWCNQSEENKKEFIRLKKAWIISDRKNDEYISSSAPNIRNNILAGISRKTSKTYIKRPLVYYSAISAAAAIILMFCLNIFVNGNVRGSDAGYACFYMPRGEKGRLFLPDGTKVWLNSDSKLTFGSDFNSKNRTVGLDGEAYFDVAKSDRHKFIVKTASVDVKVHGTAFSVAAYAQSGVVDVSLQRGSVSIYKGGSDMELASLVPNQRISIDKTSYLTEIHSFTDNPDISWTFEELIFEHAPLKEVFSKMGNWYGVNIAVASSASQQDLKYRFKIKSESLIEILELINKITPIEYKIDGKEVRIRYKQNAMKKVQGSTSSSHPVY